MTLPAQHQSNSPRRRWHNHLPDWIESSDHYLRLPPMGKTFLQAVADACQPPGPDGSLVGAFGGHQLIVSIGCHSATFWRWVKRLEALGFLTTISRGGRLTVRVGADVRNVGNVYGIPGAPGALDARRCEREMCRMLRMADGRIRRHVLRPGTQATLWHPDDLKPEPHHVNCPVNSPRMRVPHSQNASTPTRRMRVPPLAECESTIMDGISGYQNTMAQDGVFTQSRTRKKARLRHIKLIDLTDTDRLLALYTDSVGRGLVDGSDAGRLQFVAMAERALRTSQDPQVRCKGRADPLAMFAANVNAARWNWITARDDDAATRRLKAHLYGEGAADVAQDGDLRLVDGDARRQLISELESEQRQ